MATRACITLNYKCGRPGGWEAGGENASGKIPEYQSTLYPRGDKWVHP